MKNFNLICFFIANLVQNNNDIKQRFLHLLGPSNSGKTTYVVNVLTNYFGIENIGTIVGDSGFKFQDLEGKIIVIIEEFKYKSSLAGEFLKMLGGENFLISSKYSKKHKTIKKTSGVITSNKDIIEVNEEVKKALTNRLIKIEFKKTFNEKINININKQLVEEEAAIIVYCNKLLYKKIHKKRIRSKKVLQIQNNSTELQT